MKNYQTRLMKLAHTQCSLVMRFITLELIICRPILWARQYTADAAHSHFHEPIENIGCSHHMLWWRHGFSIRIGMLTLHGNKYILKGLFLFN